MLLCILSLQNMVAPSLCMLADEIIILLSSNRAHIMMFPHLRLGIYNKVLPFSSNHSKRNGYVGTELHEKWTLGSVRPLLGVVYQ